MNDGTPFSSSKRKSGPFKKRPGPQFDIGKRRRHNFGGEDTSTPTKPIETLYRILCSAKKIGGVIGRGGEIINALRDQTHAKIRVAEAIPGAEDRVVIIFNYHVHDHAVLSEEENMSMRPNCPAQDALLKVHDRIAAEEYLRGGAFHEKPEVDGEVTSRILVPNNQVGCLLGKGGSIITKLRSDTGALIRVLPGEHLPPCAMSSDQLVQISGSPAVVKKALYEVSTMLHQHPRKENPPIEEIIFFSTQGLQQLGASMPLPLQGNPGWSHHPPVPLTTPPMPFFSGLRDEPSGFHPGSGETSEEFSMKILCATGRIGGVIGKSGVNVRQLEQQTGARIQVEDTTPEAEERIIVVTSKEAPWVQISPTIDAVLQLQGRTSAISEDGSVTTRLLVSSSKVGCIIGQGGCVITELRRRTRADIRVYPKDDKPKYASADEELVQISGSQTVVKECLFEILSRLRTRTLRPPGNNVVNPSASGPFHGFAPSESLPGRGLTPYGMMGAENTVGHGYTKAPGPRNEAHGYQGPPTAPGYSAGIRHDTQGFPGGGLTTGYGVGLRHEAQGYPGANLGQRHDAQGYPGAAPATRYGAGPGHDAQVYPGQVATGFSAGPWHEGQGYPSSTTVAYNAGPRHESQGYPSQDATGYSAQGYPGTQTAPAYGAAPRHDAQGYPGAQAGAVYGAQAQGYLGQPNTTGYPNMNSSVEIKIPNSSVPSLLSAGGGQISGTRVNLHDPSSGASECVVELHGPAEQMKAAQNLLQSLIASGGQGTQLPPQGPHHLY